jgi:hypothetical protein
MYRRVEAETQPVKMSVALEARVACFLLPLLLLGGLLGRQLMGFSLVYR